jgi:hypothetical protein
LLIRDKRSVRTNVSRVRFIHKMLYDLLSLTLVMHSKPYDLAEQPIAPFPTLAVILIVLVTLGVVMIVLVRETHINEKKGTYKTDPVF